MAWLGRFFLLVLLLSFGELYLLIYVAQHLSIFLTLMLCVLTGLVGGALVRAQGLRTIRAINEATARGQVPAREIISGLILMIIGVFLLTPGFITDTVAFVMLVPAVRGFVAKLLLQHFKNRIKIGSFRSSPKAEPGGTPYRGTRPEDIVIDVEAEPVEEKVDKGI